LINDVEGIQLRLFFNIRAEGSSYEAPARSTQYQSTKRFDNLQADVNQVEQKKNKKIK